MTPRGRFLARLLTTLVTVAGFLTVGVLPAAADSNSGTVQYVALGDSYAAGQGGGGELGECLQSPNGYPYLLDPKKRIDLTANAACTGASTSEVGDQLLAVSKELHEAALVTLTVGAADLNLSGVLVACTAGTEAQCQTAIQAALLLLPLNCGDESELGSRLTDLYASVEAAAPNALIVVTGYPYLFEQPATGDPDAVIINQINTATALLNCAIEKAVADAQDDGVNIVYVDVTEEFAGHGIGSKKPFINSEGLGAYHPNAAGYRAYAKAIFAAIRSTWLDEKQAA
jgi:lysophospholipase L1-like esterase